MVLLHGLGSRGDDWEHQVPALAGAYRVVTVDLRGHGVSPRPPGAWTMRDLAADVRELITALGSAPVHLVGLSLGGMIAFQLMADAPLVVRSAAIINSGPTFPGRTLLGRTLIWSRLLTLRWRGLPGLANGIAGRLFPKPSQAHLRERFIAGMHRNDPASYARSLRAIQGFDVAAQLPAMRVPVLAVSGDRDYTPVSAKEAWVARMPNARLAVVADSGHATPMDQPDALNALLREFLDAH